MPDCFVCRVIMSSLRSIVIELVKISITTVVVERRNTTAICSTTVQEVFLVLALFRRGPTMITCPPAALRCTTSTVGFTDFISCVKRVRLNVVT